MALNALTTAVDALTAASQRPVQESDQQALTEVIAAVAELQRLKLDVVTGAAGATPITLAAITTQDTILGAVLIKDPGATTTASVVKLTPSIPSNGNVQFVEATNAAAGDRVIVLWYDKS